MGRVAGKVAFITGAARGQGREHAIRLAEEGADIIAVDACEPVASIGYELATRSDLDETVAAVESLDRRIVAEVADVRDQAALNAVVARGIAELGGLDIVSANAGITGTGMSWELEEQAWQDMIDINLTGVWHTVKAALPPMIDAGKGGSIILTSSLCGVRGLENVSHYTAAKHGVVGLMRSLANEVGRYKIRVNAVLPGNVATPMILNDVIYGLICPDVPNAGREDLEPVLAGLSAMEVGYLESRDVSNAILWLASDEARYVTAVPLSIDAGWANK
jgi:SDR family mycofactocin-dependent oxidoreductase